MKKSLKITILILLILVIIFAGLTVYFIVRSGMRLPSITNALTEVTANNQNGSIASNKYTELITQELKVPDRFANGEFAETKTLNLPEDFRISLWASGFDQPRQITWLDENNLIVAEKGSGSITLLKYSEDKSFAEKIITIDTDLNQPSSVHYFAGNLYVGVEDQILVYKEIKDDGNYSSKEILIDNLPTGGHSTRTVKVGPDRKLYITVGSSCNICDESDERRAAMLIANLDGTDVKVFASGLRNTVDFVFKSNLNDFEIWGVDNGRDGLGDNLPPEEVNQIEANQNYGWPYCYGSGINNPEYPERAGYCKTQTQGITFGMQAHSAPLGLTFLVNEDLIQRVKFPSVIFSNDLFVTFHGSWDRTQPTGYKVVRINTSESNPKEVNFITGWFQESGNIWGRPVDIKFDKNGDMFITDDKAGAIYKVEYIGVE